MAYLLDANVFIQAKNLHYGFDFCPAFWDWIDDQRQRATILSIENVRDELFGVGDELSDWADQRRDDLFLPLDAAVLPSLRTISEWASRAGYEPAGVNIFLQAADYFLVAHAHAHGHVVVTHERPSTSTRKIKIPDACIGVGVKCVTPFQMLRAEKARFVLPAS